MITRRDFLKKSCILGGVLAIFPGAAFYKTEAGGAGEYGLKPQDNYNITPGYVNLGAKVSPLQFKVL